MPAELARVEEIFAEAVTKADAAARAAYLDQACGGDAELRQRVEQLLAAHDATGNFLKLPDADGMTSPFVPVSEGPKSKIGRYKLLEQIGEGGFGVVFMAEQEEPVRRQVALKIIKLGMDTRQVVARFEAERQALAMMDHPNIARVLDAGATDTGRPYFVMELVRGVPITEYCDQNNLHHPRAAGAVRRRSARPSSTPIRRASSTATSSRRTSSSRTQRRPAGAQGDRLRRRQGDAASSSPRRRCSPSFAQLIGTPLYMSPEQAEMTGLDIDTRTRHLLARRAALRAAHRHDAVRPAASCAQPRSTKSGASSARTSRPSPARGSAHSVGPASRAGPVRPLPLGRRDRQPGIDRRPALDRAAKAGGDRPRRTRLDRHEARWKRTASVATKRPVACREDIQRYLNDEPVEALPATRSYRLKKFVRRNKVGALAGTAVVAALLVGVVLAVAGMVQARRQSEIARRQAARSEHVSQFLKVSTPKLAGPSVALGNDTKMLREILGQNRRSGATRFCR